jgi:hypothetical protein
MKKISEHFKYLVFLVSGTAIFIRAIIFVDPDFGWHLRMGEVIATKGVPLLDQFSYTMPSFLHVDHEWLFDVFFHNTYPIVGQGGLAVLFTIITLSAIAFTLARADLKGSKNPVVYGMLFLFAIGIIFPFTGIRPQVFSWFAVAILLHFLFNLQKVKRFGFLLPLLFFVWANIHASFGAGIVIFAFVEVIRTLRLRKIMPYEVMLLLISIGATFVTPYGHRVWTELWLTISDAHLRWRIQEWYPGVLFLNLPFIGLLALSMLCIYKYRHKYLPEEIGVYAGLLIQALSASRHIPLWVVATLPLVMKGFHWFQKDIQRVPFAKERFDKILLACAVSSVGVFFLTVGISFLSLIPQVQGKGYPTAAVEYLQNNSTEGNIFAPYGWGGYLIWKFPGKRLFIDGRMPSWRRKETILGESNDAMLEYLEILSGNLHFKIPAAKYNISTVLWSKDDLTNSSGLGEKLEEVFIGETHTFDLLDDLERNNWQKVYEDDVAVIYRKP